MAQKATSADRTTRLQMRLYFDANRFLGPGKVELLERIEATGSISAAGRAMAMSYKRAWMLVDDVNGTFREPIVEMVRGGAGGGGARLTAAGRRVLSSYRTIEAIAWSGAADEIKTLQSMLRDISERK